MTPTPQGTVKHFPGATKKFADNKDADLILILKDYINSGNALYLYSGGVRFKSWIGDLLL
jgi:hypothetical protein